MTDDQTSDKRPTFLNPKQAADYLGLKPNTLAKMRVYGSGPKYRKHGFRVLYALQDLIDWSEQSSRRSTSENHDA